MIKRDEYMMEEGSAKKVGIIDNELINKTFGF